MPERIKLYDNNATEYETAALLLIRWDKTQIFRLVPTPELANQHINVVMIPPITRPEIFPAEQQRIRSSFSAIPQDGSVEVLYPQRMVQDDLMEVRGYLGWLPESEDPLIPFSAYASDPFRMLTAAHTLANLFASMGDDRSQLITVDPEGFYLNTDGTTIYYLSADISSDALNQRDIYVNYIPPELLTSNHFTIDAKALLSAADYVLAVLLYRLFVGSCPFCGEDPTDQICDGISVFYDDSTPEYRRCIDQLSSLDPDLIRLFRLAFDYSSRSKCTKGRPSAADWRDALAEILKRKYGRK